MDIQHQTIPNQPQEVPVQPERPEVQQPGDRQEGDNEFIERAE